MESVPGLGSSETLEDLCTLNLIKYRPNLLLGQLINRDVVDKFVPAAVSSFHQAADSNSFKNIMTSLKTTLSNIHKNVSKPDKNTNFFVDVSHLEGERRGEELEYLTDYALANIQPDFLRENPIFSLLSDAHLQFNFAQRFSSPGGRIDRLPSHVFNITLDVYAKEHLAREATLNLERLGEADDAAQFMVIHKSRFCETPPEVYSRYDFVCKD